jgi:hypothetical protein
MRLNSHKTTQISEQQAALRFQRLEALTRDFTELLRCECAQEISSDPKEFKKCLVRLVRRALPPKRGRPNDPRIDAALRMVAEGKTVKEILRHQTRGFDKLDAYARYLAEKGLRMAIARRRTRTHDLSRGS